MPGNIEIRTETVVYLQVEVYVLELAGSRLKARDEKEKLSVTSHQETDNGCAAPHRALAEGLVFFFLFFFFFFFLSLCNLGAPLL
jgi:ABC-type Na+ efflux pump permease subunit